MKKLIFNIILLSAFPVIICCCNRGRFEKNDIIKYEDIGPVIIKFSVPKESIVNDGDSLPSNTGETIVTEINNKYKNLDSLKLIHYLHINNTLKYYEYTAKNGKGEVVNLFGAKHNDSNLVLNAFSSETKLSTESRYELDKNTLWVYKQSNYRDETVSISYTLEINRIYFGRDDGFSSWE